MLRSRASSAATPELESPFEHLPTRPHSQSQSQSHPHPASFSSQMSDSNHHVENGASPESGGPSTNGFRDEKRRGSEGNIAGRRGEKIPSLSLAGLGAGLSGKNKGKAGLRLGEWVRGAEGRISVDCSRAVTSCLACCDCHRGLNHAFQITLPYVQPSTSPLFRLVSLMKPLASDPGHIHTHPSDTHTLTPRDYLNNSRVDPAPFEFCPVFGPGDAIAARRGQFELLKSRLHMGTGARLQRVLHKAMSGAPITVSILGGSSESRLRLQLDMGPYLQG